MGAALTLTRGAILLRQRIIRESIRGRIFRDLEWLVETIRGRILILPFMVNGLPLLKQEGIVTTFYKFTISSKVWQRRLWPTASTPLFTGATLLPSVHPVRDAPPICRSLSPSTCHSSSLLLAPPQGLSVPLENHHKRSVFPLPLPRPATRRAAAVPPPCRRRLNGSGQN
ncbi:hypothetical protein SESBI_16459 [Sesbania bispinosa]|nr:hypothetical protein SESBI_16459 [Sesbania bispinosa]